MSDAPFSFRRLSFDQGSLELTEEYIRLRAYYIYEKRGRQDGHDKEDWYRAEAEILGKKPPVAVDQDAKESEPVLVTSAA